MKSRYDVVDNQESVLRHEEELDTTMSAPNARIVAEADPGATCFLKDDRQSTEPCSISISKIWQSV